MTTLAYLFGSVVPPILTSNDTHLFVELGPLPTFHFMATIKTVVSTWASFYYVQSTFRWSRGVLYRNLDWVDVIDFTFEGFSTDHRSYGGVCGSIADSALLVQSTYHPPPPTLEKRRKEKKRRRISTIHNYFIGKWLFLLLLSDLCRCCNAHWRCLLAHHFSVSYLQSIYAEFCKYCVLRMIFWSLSCVIPLLRYCMIVKYLDTEK